MSDSKLILFTSFDRSHCHRVAKAFNEECEAQRVPNCLATVEPYESATSSQGNESAAVVTGPVAVLDKKVRYVLALALLRHLV